MREAPCLLVLDNFETVTHSDAAGAADLLARLRSGASGVLLGVGFRGAAPPPGTGGIRSVHLRPLSDTAAMGVFIAVAGDRHRDDPQLTGLLNDLDGVPLAIVLLGALASSESRLDGLAAAWRAKRTDLLQRTGLADRTSSLPVSLELSWERLTQEGRNALSVAAMLPDGWPSGHPNLYFPLSGMAGLIEIGHHALLHDDGIRRRCLAPIRQHMLARHPATTKLRQQLLATVETLIHRCDEIGQLGGSAAIADLYPEFINLVNILRTSLTGGLDTLALVPPVLRFQRFTGLGDDQLGREALATKATSSTKAMIMTGLAQLHLNRSRNDEARKLFHQALPLYQQVGDVLGEANTLRNLGELEFRESRNDEARKLFGRAVTLYQHIRDRYSEAITHAYLARMAEDDERAEHCSRMDALAGELGQPGFRESLRSIADC